MNRYQCVHCGRLHSSYSACRPSTRATWRDVAEIGAALAVWSVWLFILLYLLPTLVAS